jgi:hypothetical protein
VGARSVTIRGALRVTMIVGTLVYFGVAFSHVIRTFDAPPTSFSSKNGLQDQEVKKGESIQRSSTRRRVAESAELLLAYLIGYGLLAAALSPVGVLLHEIGGGAERDANS